MDEAQVRWRQDNRRSNPASEGELLEVERALGDLSRKRRFRVLGMFHACAEDGKHVALTEELLRGQDFGSLSFVGAVSTLLGQEGLASQCLWYSDDGFDWFWALVTNIESIELRTDKRFRGGTPCVWLTTPIAEYALAIPHSTFSKAWEDTLEFFNAPRCAQWPKTGTRPDWWPPQSCGRWPGDLYPGEVPSAISPDVELRQLIQELSMESASSGVPWRRLGPKGDRRFPGQPLHNLGQLLDWDLAYDAGLKVTRSNTGGDGDLHEPGEGTGARGDGELNEPGEGTGGAGKKQKRKRARPHEQHPKKAKGANTGSG
ncbi:hypothetical protein FRC08_014414 [Ceratobasidium sp. 394]|nr:hypothetical protein FRC08_014414 [Ceratobasidium sp. 394]KAG9102117.1 hypothetical protein FS749_015700 [Ceratobasidium sp. UAMH 11750]